ncbi:hypothetical protein, partial [uncultured Thiodictyon sp.]|uniref:hypothetical protein n=1 Tax=uncultured Thiodictyon sp. TaxID=1846217 RepID=UPI0025DBF190
CNSACERIRGATITSITTTTTTTTTTRQRQRRDKHFLVNSGPDHRARALSILRRSRDQISLDRTAAAGRRVRPRALVLG